MQRSLKSIDRAPIDRCRSAGGRLLGMRLTRALPFLKFARYGFSAYCGSFSCSPYLKVQGRVLTTEDDAGNDDK
jgi:hypothetical protein